METVLDVIIVLFWTVFFLATIFGVLGEYQKNKVISTDSPLRKNPLEDDDTVFLMGPFVNE